MVDPEAFSDYSYKVVPTAARGSDYGVATMSRRLKITGLFCRI